MSQGIPNVPVGPVGLNSNQLLHQISPAERLFTQCATHDNLAWGTFGERSVRQSQPGAPRTRRLPGLTSWYRFRRWLVGEFGGMVDFFTRSHRSLETKRDLAVEGFSNQARDALHILDGMGREAGNNAPIEDLDADWRQFVAQLKDMEQFCQTAARYDRTSGSPVKIDSANLFQEGVRVLIESASPDQRSRWEAGLKRLCNGMEQNNPGFLNALSDDATLFGHFREACRRGGINVADVAPLPVIDAEKEKVGLLLTPDQIRSDIPNHVNDVLVDEYERLREYGIVEKLMMDVLETIRSTTKPVAKGDSPPDYSKCFQEINPKLSKIRKELKTSAKTFNKEALRTAANYPTVEILDLVACATRAAAAKVMANHQFTRQYEVLDRLEKGMDELYSGSSNEPKPALSDDRISKPSAVAGQRVRKAMDPTSVEPVGDKTEEMLWAMRKALGRSELARLFESAKNEPEMPSSYVTAFEKFEQLSEAEKAKCKDPSLLQWLDGLRIYGLDYGLQDIYHGKLGR